MDKKQRILSEIRRTAEENGGTPLGRRRFSDITGISPSEWSGKAWNEWNTWGDVVKEAGFDANKKPEAYDENVLIEHLIGLIAKLGKFPVQAELRREASRNKDFPSHTIWKNRLGSKPLILEKLVSYCLRSPEDYRDVLQICEPLLSAKMESKADFEPEKVGEVFGFVYLMKSGKYYKIGNTKALDRRQYEIGLQLPEKIIPVHSIRTDDPSGIEAYWHNRFKDKRLNGEWFDLKASDIRIFKKRKFM
jgi:hypothetical protein